MKNQILAAGFITALLLSSCGGSGNGSKQTSDSTTTDSTKKTMAAARSGQLPADPNTVINVSVLQIPLSTAVTMGAGFLANYRAMSFAQVPVPFTRGFSSVSVSLADLATLKSKIQPGTNQTYGLRIYYGLNGPMTTAAAYQQTIIFEPVILSVDSVNTDSIYMAVNENKQWFTYTQQFVPVVPDSFSAWVARYKSNTQKQTQGTWSNITIDDALGAGSDPRSITIPWVELDSLIQDNSTAVKPGPDAITMSTITGVSFTLAAETMADGTFRQTVIFLPNLTGQSGKVNPAIFTKAGGNMASLCPPRCGQIQYQINSAK